jgi:mono/diheme cytochrome c family protein
VLTIAIVFVALLLPALVLAELWRSRRVSVPDDAPEPQIDPVLSTAGMSRKIVFAMVALAEAFLLLIAYSANEPFRQSHASERQLELSVEAGAHTYVQYCLSCHGGQGRGFLENVGLPGKPLNRGDLQVLTGDDAAAARKMVYQTIQNGRAGTIMPAWGVENNGPLNYAMIDELVALVNHGRWDVVDHIIKAEAVALPTEPAITAANQVEVGRKIVTEGACASCHAVANTPARGQVGPALDGIASRQIAGVIPFTRDNMKRWILNPPQIKPGTQMPPYAFREQYLDAIVAYLETLR